ncbi:hypothetical protein [Burkholderia sp. BE17]|uniref:hypothetical protein n=1 Tax=Burkholderia sp. BE17 TaxID=2656644 RepID=UPI00187B7CC1|nr:hypothetical protein [Burkholderia sp. BE17]
MKKIPLLHGIKHNVFGKRLEQSDRAARCPGTDRQCAAIFHACTVVDLRLHERESGRDS